MKRLTAVLLCLALLLSLQPVFAQEAPVFDDGAFAGADGYTLAEDGTWTYVSGASMPYPQYDVVIRITASGAHGGAAPAPQLQIALLKTGTEEAAKQVSGITFAIDHSLYCFHKLPEGTFASVPLYTKGKPFVEALARANETTIGIYYEDDSQSINVLWQFFLPSLKKAAKALLEADYWDYLTDPDGSLAALEEQYPLTIEKLR